MYVCVNSEAWVEERKHKRSNIEICSEIHEIVEEYIVANWTQVKSKL